MTTQREFNAATVEEAVEKAANNLGVSSDGISYEVADSGSSGFMGIGARDARILVTVEDAAEEAPEADPPPPTAQEKPEPEPDTTAEAPLEDETAASVEAAPEELLDDVRQFMETAIEGLDLTDVRLDVYDAGEFVAVDVVTEEAGLFIGQKGETIDALQYLLNVATYRDRPFAKRITLDTEGYRQRRIEALQGMAHRSARRALRERRTVELSPMNAAERRIVHVFLKDNGRVSTRSEGTGENRRVAISPS